jgi:hypothetical protein
MQKDDGQPGATVVRCRRSNGTVPRDALNAVEIGVVAGEIRQVVSLHHRNNKSVTNQKTKLFA